MPNADPFENQDIKRLRLLVYLIPIAGFFPAVWVLARRRGTRQERNLSRFAITLAIGWVSGDVLLGAGAQGLNGLALPLLVASSLLTSGYFGTNLWLMLRVLQRKPLRIPGVSQVSDRLP